MLQIIFAIFVTYLLIKVAHKFDSLASDIEVIPLVFLPGLFAIVLNFLITGNSWSELIGLLILPGIFLIALLRLRKYDLLPWGRAFLYSCLVVISFITTEIIFAVIFFS